MTAFGDDSLQRAPELELRDLRRYFSSSRGLLGRFQPPIRAVDGVSLDLAPGTTLGLVGESGCGKSTLGRLAVRLIEPSSGAVLVSGAEIGLLPKRSWRLLRPRVQMVFQDTQASLDPRLTVEAIVAEPLRINGVVPRAEVYERVVALAEQVGLTGPHLQRYPHELSGGQRQRVVIARALATEPRLLVLDEPTSALDVSVQAQILNLLKDLQDRFSLSYLFISHNLSVVRAMSDEVAVMYLGEIVERGPADAIFENPAHPYTRLLFGSMPRPDPAHPRQRLRLEGDVPRADAPPCGCRFHPRCFRAEALCSQESPALVERQTGHPAACHFAHEFVNQPLDYVS